MKRLILLTLCITTVGLLPIFINMGNPIYEVDFISQQIPFILETKKMFSSLAPWWSWDTFNGDNFVGAYSFYTFTSPFVWFICLFSVKYILVGFFIALYLKMICLASFSYLYFKKMKFDENLSLLGGLLFSFSSFIISNLFYYHFLEPIMLFPLLLIALENVIAGHKRCWFYLALISFAIFFINFYFAPCSLILGFSYLLFRAHGEHKLKFALVIKAIGSVFVGCMLSSFILAPVIFQHIGVPRTKANHDLISILGFTPTNIPSIAIHYLPLLRSIISPDFTDGMTDIFLPANKYWKSNEAYIQLFGVFLSLIYIRKHRNWLSAIIITLLVMYLTPLSGIFSLFTSIHYTRWAYGLTMFLIVASLKQIQEKKEISRRALWWYIGFVSIIVLANYGFDFILRLKAKIPLTLTDDNMVWLTLTVVNVGCLITWLAKGKGIRSAILLVSICSALNFIAFSQTLFGEHPDQNKVGERILNATRQLPYNESGEFQYRTDHTSHTRNLNIFIGKPGIYGFHSSMNPKMHKLRSFMCDSAGGPSFCNKTCREPIAALMSVKEVYDFPEKMTYIKGYTKYKYGLIPKEKHDKYVVCDYKYYIPFGFSYDNYVTSDELESYVKQHNDFEIGGLLLDNLVIDPKDTTTITRLLKHGRINQPATIDSLVDARKKYTVSNLCGNTKGFTCKSNFSNERVVFFSVAADPGFSPKIDGKPTRLYEVNCGMSAIIVPAGKHEIQFSYFPYGMKTGIYISLGALLLLLLLYFHPYLAGKITENNR